MEETEKFFRTMNFLIKIAIAYVLISILAMIGIGVMVWVSL